MADDHDWNIGISASAASADRARERAEARERRAEERSTMAQARAERRAAEREQASRERETMREARRNEQSDRMRTLRPDRAPDRDSPEAEPKRRASGAIRRTGEIRIERDTRHYTTRVDVRRIRELSRRGATMSGLATVFGISEEAVMAALADPEPVQE